MHKHCCVHLKYTSCSSFFCLTRSLIICVIIGNKTQSFPRLENFIKEGKREINVVYDHNVNTRKGVRFHLKNSVVDTCVCYSSNIILHTLVLLR